MKKYHRLVVTPLCQFTDHNARISEHFQTFKTFVPVYVIHAYDYTDLRWMCHGHVATFTVNMHEYPGMLRNIRML